MVIDFGDLKRVVNEQIINRLDHSFVMRRSPRALELFDVMSTQFSNVQLVDYQPTCENMLSDFASRIASQLPQGVELHALKLHETATSFAEWYAEDNKI